MIGLLVFCLVMVLLTVGFRFFGSKYYDKIYGPEGQQGAKSVVAVSEPVRSDETNDEELVAVITAAANAVMQKTVVVKRIRSLSSPNETAWSQSGRLNVMGTHSIKINR